MTTARVGIEGRFEPGHRAGVVQPLLAAAGPLARARWILVPLLGAVMGGETPGLPPADLGYFNQMGHAILRGHLGIPYRTDTNQGGPLQLVAATVVPHGWINPHGAMLVLVTVWGLVVAPSAMIAVRVIRRGFHLEPSALHELAAGVGTAVWIVGGNMFAGHFAESAIPLFWVAAAISARRGQVAPAAVLLGLSAAWEPWGLLGIPIALLSPRRRDVVVTTAVSAVVALICYTPFILSGHFAIFRHVWPIDEGTFVHWLMPHTAVFGWPLRLLQSSLAIAAGAGSALALRRRVSAVWLVPFVIVLVRLIFDPTGFVYYWVAAKVPLVAGVAVMNAGHRVRLALFVAAAWCTSSSWGPLRVPNTMLALILATSLIVLEHRSPIRSREARNHPLDAAAFLDSATT